MLGISVSKFHELFPVVENEDPHRLHARLGQTPSESHLKNSTRHTLLWGRLIIFSDDWQVDGDRAIVRDVTVVVIYGIPIFHSHVPILLINLSSMGLPINWWQISNSTLYLLRCQFMRDRSTADVLFFKYHNLVIYGIFWCVTFFWKPTSTFCRFSSKTLRLYLISHNLGLSEHGKSLVFSFPVLKQKYSLTTPSPSTPHVLRVVEAVL